MSNIASVTSVIEGLRPVVRRPVPYLIIAAVVTAVAIALFFLIKKASQFYSEWRVTFHDEVTKEVSHKLKVGFDKEKAELMKNSADELKVTKQAAAQEREKIKAQAYNQLQKGNQQIADLMPKTTEFGLGKKKAIEKLTAQIKASNPLVALESLLTNPTAFETVRREWEGHFKEKREEVVAYLPLFLKGRGDKLLMAAEDELINICSKGDAETFLDFIQNNHTFSEIYEMMKADETEISMALESGNLTEVKTNGLKCLETIKDKLKDLYASDKAALKPMIQTLVRKLESEAEDEAATYLDAFLEKIGMDTVQEVGQPLLTQLEITAPTLVQKTLGFALKQLTNEKNWAALVTLLIHFL